MNTVNASDSSPNSLDALRGTISQPVMTELSTERLEVTGEIPAALRGVYMRNGANPVFPALGAYHPFDGDGMVHGVYLDNGVANYKNRFVDTPGLRQEKEAGKALFGGLSNIVFPEAEVMEKEGGLFKNAANTNVYRHADKVLALWEGGFPTELTMDLETVGLYDFDGGFDEKGIMSAHPKWDARTGEMMFCGYSGLEKPYVHYNVVDKNGVMTHRTPIDIPRGTMMHDFLTTENYSIIFDMPAVIEPMAMAAGEPVWQPQLGCRIGVIPRYGTNADIRWFETDPFFVFHFMNAWEASENVIKSYGCRLPSIDLDFENADPDAISGEGMGLYCWTIDLQAGTVTEDKIADNYSFGDFPRINDDHNSYQTRYGHLSGSTVQAELGGFDAIFQYDLEQGDVVTYKLADGHVTGEAVFAADPNGTDERDGWILSYDTDKDTLQTDLLILDGHDITTEVARVHMPQLVPFGFHGNWMPTD